ncbi:putative protein N(5)-glutamine methyltransferase, partial [Motilibacter deserti]
AGRPLEQVLGWAEFCGLRVRLEAGVFVPRRRSEHLVAVALRRLGPGTAVLDLCCGSGALGLALATARRGVEVYAVDSDPVAARCAQGNLEPVGGTVLVGDLFAPLPPRLCGRLAAIVAVPPYVPTEEIRLMPPEARDHEPRGALDGGADGLDVARAIALGAGAWLAPGGAAYVEVAAHQAPAAAAAFTGTGLRAGVEQDEESGSTVVVGRRA